MFEKSASLDVHHTGGWRVGAASVLVWRHLAAGLERGRQQSTF
jgi:hypothetical protein